MLTMLAVRRVDTGQWAMPGGMVNDGENPAEAARREFTETCGNFEDNENGHRLRDEFEDFLDVAFGEVMDDPSRYLVFRGYVDDPRNTDNAWMETSAFHIHLPESVQVPIKAGDDADAAQWITLDAEVDTRYANMYGNHKEVVDTVADTLNPHVLARKPHGEYKRLEIDDEKVRWAVAGRTTSR